MINKTTHCVVSRVGSAELVLPLYMYHGNTEQHCAGDSCAQLFTICDAIHCQAEVPFATRHHGPDTKRFFTHYNKNLL
jgi:hypothetical protein